MDAIEEVSDRRISENRNSEEGCENKGLCDESKRLLHRCLPSVLQDSTLISFSLQLRYVLNFIEIKVYA